MQSLSFAFIALVLALAHGLRLPLGIKLDLISPAALNSKELPCNVNEVEDFGSLLSKHKKVRVNLPLYIKFFAIDFHNYTHDPPSLFPFPPSSPKRQPVPHPSAFSLLSQAPSHLRVRHSTFQGI